MGYSESHIDASSLGHTIEEFSNTKAKAQTRVVEELEEKAEDLDDNSWFGESIHVNGVIILQDLNSSTESKT